MSASIATTNNMFPVGTDLKKFKSLRDILCSSVPPPPKVDPPEALGDTKGTTKTEVTMFPLNTIVYCPQMFESLLAKGEEITKHVSFDHTNIQHQFFAAYTIPSIATSLYPKKFHSEEAVAWWSTFTILWPAMAALRCLRCDLSSVGFNNEETYPFLSSGAAIRIVPDAVVVTGDAHKGTEGLPQIDADIEFKSPNAFAGAKLDSLMPDLQKQPTAPQNTPATGARRSARVKSVAESAKSKGAGVEAGEVKAAPYAYNAMRFYWPEAHLNTRQDHQTRVIVQIWAQMVHRKANVGLLSCADRTVLFIRDRETSIVYMSPQYGPEDRPILAVFSLFAAGLGLIKTEDLKVEEMTRIIDPEAVKTAAKLKKVLAKRDNSKIPDKTDQRYLGIVPRYV